MLTGLIHGPTRGVPRVAELPSVFMDEQAVAARADG
jgi:hypothetical protein